MTAEERFRDAVRQMMRAGEYPSPGALQRRLGKRVTHNLNGRECRWREEEMLKLGWERVASARVVGSKAWAPAWVDSSVRSRR